jgi:hypothetical protein
VVGNVVSAVEGSSSSEGEALALKVYRHLTNYAEACSSRRENIEAVRDQAFAALQPSSAADAKPVAVVAVPRLDMKVAIADAIWRYDNGEFTAARVAMVKAQDILSRAQPRPSQQAGAEGERDYLAEFEEWWATYRNRNRETADYSMKKQIAFDAFYFAALKPVEG